MSDTLYPVPREPAQPAGPSRLVAVVAAEVTARGILRGRDQPPLTVAPPRLVNAPRRDEVTQKGVLRGRDQLLRTVDPPRFVLVKFAELTSRTILRHQRHAIGVERLPRVFLAPSGPLTGTGAVTLDPLTSTGAGAVAVTGTSATTLDALTSAAAGTIGVTGSSASTLAPLTTAGAGVVGSTPILGISASTLAPLMVAGIGIVTGSGGAPSVEPPPVVVASASTQSVRVFEVTRSAWDEAGEEGRWLDQ